MFRDLFKNKAALLILGGAFALILALVLVFMFVGGGTFLSGGRAGGSGFGAAFISSGEVTPIPTQAPAEQTPAPTPAQTPPAATAKPSSAGALYVSERLGFSMQLAEGMTADDTSEDSSVYLMLNGVKVGGVIRSEGTTRDILETERDDFLYWTLESSGADDLGEITQEAAEVGAYPAVFLAVELLIEGEPAYYLYNWFIDAASGGCYVLSYMSLVPFDEAEAELVVNALSTFTMLGSAAPPQEAPPLDGYDTYTSTAFGFSVQYPDGYTIETGLSENTVDFLWDRNADVGFEIELYKNATAGDIHAATLSFERFSDFNIKLVDQKTITRGQYEYISLRYTFSIESDFVYERNILIVGQNAYVISWGAPTYLAPEMPADADVFLKSFKVLGY